MPVILVKRHLSDLRPGAVRLLAALALLVTIASRPDRHVRASTPPPQRDNPSGGSISPYWLFEINQWESHIVRFAEEYRMDPDLLAALIWQESQGLSWVQSSTGAVGLMQVMPADSGFVHRPSAEQLLRPSTNISWGTRIFSEIIQEANGDLFTALAAYNGGWYQTWMDSPQEYAREVVTHYAEAVAVRNGYQNPAIREWGLVIELQGRDDVDLAASPQPGWLVTSHITGPRPTLGKPLMGAVVYSAVTPEGRPWRITMWLLPNE